MVKWYLAILMVKIRFSSQTTYWMGNCPSAIFSFVQGGVEFDSGFHGCHFISRISQCVACFPLKKKQKLAPQFVIIAAVSGGYGGCSRIYLGRAAFHSHGNQIVTFLAEKHLICTTCYKKRPWLTHVYPSFSHVQNIGVIFTCNEIYLGISHVYIGGSINEGTPQ